MVLGWGSEEVYKLGSCKEDNRVWALLEGPFQEPKNWLQS